MTGDELAELLAAGEVQLLDVRSAEEYDGIGGYGCDPRQGHIPGAVNIDVSELAAAGADVRALLAEQRPRQRAARSSATAIPARARPTPWPRSRPPAWRRRTTRAPGTSGRIGRSRSPRRLLGHGWSLRTHLLPGPRPRRLDQVLHGVPWASSTCAPRRSATRPRTTSSRYPGDPEPWLELTHNHDRTEPYEIGTGYGHIAIKVDDLDGTLAALDEKGVQPERAPYLVGTTRICFVRDPDGYRIELIERK